MADPVWTVGLYGPKARQNVATWMEAVGLLSPAPLRERFGVRVHLTLFARTERAADVAFTGLVLRERPQPRPQLLFGRTP